MKDKKLYQINVIAGLDLRPVAWRVIKTIGDGYSLQITYQEPDNGVWFDIQNKRGEVKIFRAIKTAMSEIDKVEKSRECVIYYQG